MKPFLFAKAREKAFTLPKANKALEETQAVINAAKVLEALLYHLGRVLRMLGYLFVCTL